MVDKSPNLFDVDGINIYMTYDDAVDVFENQDIVDGSPLIEDPDVYPLVAEGFFGSDGVWYFHKTYSDGVDYTLEYDEFINAVHETK